MTDARSRPLVRPAPFWRRLGIDPWLLVVLGAMIGLGLVMVYSASWDVSWRLLGDANALFQRQLTNVLLSIVAMIGAAWFPLRWIRKLALPAILVSILALLLVLLLRRRRPRRPSSRATSEMAVGADHLRCGWIQGHPSSEWG
jgi:cell division protein FtsW (lipid II flippase)